MTMRNTARVRSSSTHRSANKRRASSSSNGRRGSNSKRKTPMNEHHAQQFLDKPTTTARDTIQKSTAAVEQSTRSVERRYFGAANTARDFNMMFTELAQSNITATLNFAWELAAARNPTQAAAVCYYHTHKNYERLTEQLSQLTALAQRLIAFAAPEGPGLPQQLQGTSRPFLRLVTP